MNAAMTARLIRFQHPEKVLPYLGKLSDDRLAAVFGLDPDLYRRLRQDHHEQARSAAVDLLDDPRFAAKVDRLPFAPVMLEQGDLGVDARHVVTRQPTEPFHLDDGVHLSLAGQQAVTTALVDALTDRPGCSASPGSGALSGGGSGPAG
jgi:hypothetical protein